MATLRQKISGLIKKAENTTLVTVNAKGAPRCRLMGNLATGAGKTFYLATYVASNKVKEIKANPRVNMVYTTARSYACVVGRAKVRTDQKTKSRLWQKDWVQYFPGGKTDPNYAVIEVAATRIDYFELGFEQPATLKL